MRNLLEKYDELRAAIIRFDYDTGALIENTFDSVRAIDTPLFHETSGKCGIRLTDPAKIEFESIPAGLESILNLFDEFDAIGENMLDNNERLEARGVDTVESLLASSEKAREIIENWPDSEELASMISEFKKAA